MRARAGRGGLECIAGSCWKVGGGSAPSDKDLAAIIDGDGRRIIGASSPDVSRVDQLRLGQLDGCVELGNKDISRAG